MSIEISVIEEHTHKNNLQSENTALKKEDIDAETTPVFQGFIEQVLGGFATGWAANMLNAEPLNIAIITGDERRVLGTGIANKFRPDLKAAKIHDGFHMFTIPINGELDKDVDLHLVDTDSDQIISIKPFALKMPSQYFWVSMDRVRDGNCIEGTINSDQPIDKQKLRLFVDDKQVAESDFESDQCSIPFRIGVPVKLMDQVEHLFVATIDGYPLAAGFQSFIMSSITTPWEHLKESHHRPNIASISAHANRRYDALRYHLEAISRGKGILSIDNLSNIHNMIVESWHGRKKFPQFDLPKHDHPDFSIIVPAYNKFELTYHSIASVALAYNHSSYEVILADDNSTDKTSEAENIIGNLIISRNAENLRFLKNCNQASKLARGKYIVFLNNDTEVSSFWLDELLKVHSDDDTIGLTGSKLLNEDGTLQEAGGIIWGNGQPWNVGRDANPQQPEFNYRREVDYVTGAAMCIRRDLWEQVGKFSEELAPCYYEDPDLAFKVRAAGYKTVYVPHSVVVHFEGKSHGKDTKKGLKRYQVVNESKFRAKWFKDFRHNGIASLDNMMLQKDRNIEQRIMVIDCATPAPNKDAGGYAVHQEIRMMLELGFKVTFVPDNVAYMGKYTDDLQKMGVEVLYSPFYTSTRDAITRRIKEMDAVYIIRYDIAERYIDQIRAESEAKILFNNCDLHFLRELRAHLHTGTDLSPALQTRDRELGLMRKVDVILSYNETEQAVILSHNLRMDNIFKCPWVLGERKKGLAFEEREGIAFLGGFNHTPNREAVKFLVEEIMPKLAITQPDIKLYVYGSRMPEEFHEWSADNIEMVGFIENLDDLFHRHRVFVAPLLSGAGIKGKVLESMAYGLPCILTDIAAEGTGLSHNISALFAHDTSTFESAIQKLYSDKKLWNRITENLDIIVETNYSFEHGLTEFKKIFAYAGIYSTRNIQNL
jgi:GT2 family glycosyltransferase